MRKSAIIALCLLALVPGFAQAQTQERGPKVGDFAPDIEAKEWILDAGAEVPSLSELRGLVVVLVFWVSWHDGAAVVLPYINMYANNPGIGTTGGIVTIGLTDADRKTTEPLVKSNKVFFPVGCGSKGAEEYGFEGGWGVVVIDTEGKVAFKGQPQDMNGWLNQVSQMLNNSPPTRTHPAEARIAIQQIRKAREFIREEKFADAARETRDALERSVLGDKLKSEAMAMIDLMNLVGYERLRRIDALLDEKKFKDAAEITRQVSRSFQGLQVSKDARRRHETLMKENDGYKKAVETYASEDVAYKLFREARELVKQKRIADAYMKLDEILTKHAASEVAEHAKAMVERMKGIPVAWQYVIDRQATEAADLLSQARSLNAQGRCKEAKALLEKVMSEYHDTTYADEAKRELVKLPC